MMGACSIGCLIYGVSQLLKWLGVLILLFILLIISQKIKANRLDELTTTTAGKTTVKVRYWLLFSLCFVLGVGGILTSTFINMRGVEMGLFAGQKECPGYWFTPRSLKG